MKKSLKILSFALSGVLVCSVNVYSLTEAQKQRRELAQAMNFAFGSGNNIVWKNEKNPMQRDVLHEPMILNQPLKHKEQSVSLFFTRTGSLCYSLSDMVDLSVVQKIATDALEMKYALDNDALDEPDPDDHDTYPDGVNDAQYIADLEEYLSQSEIPARTASQIIACANQITFQEHRIGAALYKKWHYKDLFISVRSWLGLAERNYWLDKQYRDRLTGLMQQLFPKNDGSFTMSDYVTMNWGLGDTHVRAGWSPPVGKDDACTVRVGLKGILPTAHQPRRATAFQLVPLRLDDFGMFARSRVNEAFISPNLGNRGHYGAGLWGDASWCKSFFDNKHQAKIKIYAAADYLVPATEERLLMRYVDSSVTAQRGTFRTTNDGLFRAFIGQFVLPEPIEVVVAPGAILTAGALCRYRIGHVDFSGGYDWYFKAKEAIIRCIDADDVAVYIPQQEAVVSNSIQHKVFGGVSYNVVHHDVSLGGFTFPKLALSFGLSGAASLSAAGMGKDFGIGLSFGCKC